MSDPKYKYATPYTPAVVQVECRHNCAHEVQTDAIYFWIIALVVWLLVLTVKVWR